MRKRRAAAKALKTPPDTPRAVSAPMTLPTAEKLAVAKPAKLGKSKKPKGAVSQHRVWRKEVATFFEEMLTHPTCPLSGQDFSSSRTYGLYFGIFERLTQIENIANNADQLAELRLSVAVECLRRLTGETPARSAQALPHKAA
jgi:hypothetical protein